MRITLKLIKFRATDQRWKGSHSDWCIRSHKLADESYVTMERSSIRGYGWSQIEMSDSGRVWNRVLAAQVPVDLNPRFVLDCPSRYQDSPQFDSRRVMW